jgi:uncharacterized protein YbaR (Trm112 family)
VSIHPELLEILCDPVTKQPVVELDADRLARLNRAIASGNVKDSDGNAVERALDEALVTEDGTTVYRVDSGIPIMLAEMGIPTAQVEGF